MASVRSRNGKWQARVKRDGVAVEKTFLNKRDADKWARLTEAGIERGDYEPPPQRATREDAHPQTLADVLQRYKNEVADSHRSATTRINVTTLIHTMGGTTISDLNAQAIARWRDDRLQAVKPPSVVRELNTLSAVLNHARKEWCYPIANPIQDIKRPAQGQRRERRLEGDEENRLLSELAPHYGFVVRFALHTAMRRGEILSLLWRNVDLTNRVAVLPVTKNGESRRVPLSTEAANVLIEQRSALGNVVDFSGRVFPVHHISLDKAWRRACKRAGIEGLHFHDLRHEAVSRLFERGLNPIEVASISGHKTMAMLQRYTHLKAERLAEKLG